MQRDTGGYAVALAASMKHIFCGAAGRDLCSPPATSAGWSAIRYIVYGPLIAGMATILYEGLPIRPDAGIWWKIVEEYKVTVMFSAPTAIRVLKKQDPAFLQQARPVDRCEHLFLAGEPLDEPTARWIAEALGQAGHRQLLADRDRLADPDACHGVETTPSKFGSPGLPVYGYDVRLLREADGERGRRRTRRAWSRSCRRCRPAACRRSGATTSASSRPTSRASRAQLVYSTFDWGIRDADGYYFILGRTDDVINVAGHRLGTREIEESGRRRIRTSPKSRWSASPTR